MPQLINKSDLSEPEQRLVEMLQGLDFGRIEELLIRDGKPVFDPPPRVVETLKMKRENRAREEASLREFSLKQSVVRLFLVMRQIGDGKILLIQVRHGLPVTVEIERLRNH
ncbi:MAG TPA: hypothetical protein VMB85_02245 [Bryobacteraceae bacterium]|nr:hypothetical protein [Bryobacteraceae bacterium]